MILSASSDFVALCRSQVVLLTQGLGASFGVVYLAEEFVQAGTTVAKLMPIVVFPDTAVVAHGSLALPPPVIDRANMQPRPLPALPSFQSPLLGTGSQKEAQSEYAEDQLGIQIVLPLVYEDLMMGLLVTGREDRPWNEQERSHIERVAQTLAIACILDRRRAWFEHELHVQQQASAQQRDLLDNLLHQFRNPLTALRTFGKLLLKRLQPGDVNREVANSIVRESDRLKELLQQFDYAIDFTALPSTPAATLATIDPAKPLLLLPNAQGEKELCWVGDILEPLLVSARAIATERDLQLQTEIPPELPPVRVSSQCLREVFSNLIDNALKYTPAGGQISLQAGLEKERFQGIAISDTGPGIPPEDKKHLFERHYRGVQAQTEIPGTGLGLAIARELLEQMQGEIQVESPAINTNNEDHPGTTFIVWLPTTK
jgi:signal transduction histidine kinase